MAYIGSTPTSQNFISGTDYFNGTGSQTAFTLTRSVNSVNDVEVVVNNVIQQPNSYTVSGTTLTLSAAPSSGTSNVYVRYLSTNQQSFTVGNNTVGYNQLTTDMQSKFAMKNRIINGAMVISQRYGTSSVSIPSTATYTLDRYGTVASQSSKFSVQQNAGSVTPPVGFTNYLGVTSSSAYSVPSNEIFCLYQNIEGFNTADLQWGTSNAKTITISFWVRSSLTGTFGGSVANENFDRSYPYSYTISSANTWEFKSITITGDTAGTWVGATNGIGMRVYFPIGVGATYSGTAGAWAAGGLISATGATSVVGTSGATFYITGVQLEVGSSATGYEYRQYTTELCLCQRYYQRNTDQNLSAGGFTGQVLAVATQFAIGQATFKVTMRSTPTIVLYDNQGTVGAVTQAGNADGIVSTASTDKINNCGFGQTLRTTGTYGSAYGYPIIAGYTASAEL